MNLCTCFCCDCSRLARRQDIMQSTSRVFAKSTWHFSFQKRQSRISSAGRRNRSPFDSFYRKALNIFDLLFIHEEVNCKGTVATCLPRNVRIQADKPRKVGGLESSLDQILEENSSSVSSASALLGISVVNSDVELR